MLRIRLQRIGKKKQPSYRLVVSDRTRDTQGESVEIIGKFDPFAKENAFVFMKDRVEYWMSKGAQPSETVHNMLVTAGAIKADKQKSVKISQKRQKKLAAKKAE